MPDRTGYSLLQIALHWLIAILVLAAWLASDDMGDALRDRIESGASGIEGNTLHVWLGGAVLALVLLRIAVRLIGGAPGPVPGTPPVMATAAAWGHRLLYLLMVLGPALGAAAWYGGVEIAEEGHELAANALMVVALGHAAVALWHHYGQNDGSLTRMMKPQG